jgi:cyanophycin synthetase
MRIIDLRTMRGPSYWSVKHTKLIVAKVDLEEFAGKWSNTVTGLGDRLMKLFPKIGQAPPTA